MTAGAKTSEFALTVLLLVMGGVIALVNGMPEAESWLEAAWPPVAAYAAARAITKATQGDRGIDVTVHDESGD